MTTKWVMQGVSPKQSSLLFISGRGRPAGGVHYTTVHIMSNTSYSKLSREILQEPWREYLYDTEEAAYGVLVRLKLTGRLEGWTGLVVTALEVPL